MKHTKINRIYGTAGVNPKAEKKETVIARNDLAEESPVITEADYNEFMQAETYDERMRILSVHSEKNNEAIKRRSKETKKTQKQTEQGD